MAIRLYLDEDVDPLLAKALRDRGFDCLSTRDAGKLGAADQEQLSFAARERRAILTFNIRDFLLLAKSAARAGKSHGGIIVSQHLAFRDLLRRVLVLMDKHHDSDMSDQVLWLQDYKEPA